MFNSYVYNIIIAYNKYILNSVNIAIFTILLVVEMHLLF
nr:MAG TPA: hypothetical protein [Caudoviricetes sp.]